MLPLKGRRFAKSWQAGDGDESKDGTDEVNLSPDDEHGEIHDPSLDRRYQPVTDIAISVATGTDTILTSDSTVSGRSLSAEIYSMARPRSQRP